MLKKKSTHFSIYRGSGTTSTKNTALSSNTSYLDIILIKFHSSKGATVTSDRF
jgi:hypothetical protein